MVDLDADAHQYRLDEIKELEADIARLKQNCYEQYKRIEKLETSFGELMKAWEFWQSQETKNGFSELCAAYWDAKAALAGEKKDE